MHPARIATPMCSLLKFKSIDKPIAMKPPIMYVIKKTRLSTTSLDSSISITTRLFFSSITIINLGFSSQSPRIPS